MENIEKISEPSIEKLNMREAMELEFLGWKARVFAYAVSKYLKENLAWGNVGRVTSTIVLLCVLVTYNTGCTKAAPLEVLISDTVSAQVEEQSTTAETLDSTKTVVDIPDGDTLLEQSVEEEKENLLAGYDNSWTYEEIDKIVPEYQGIERSVNAKREKYYPDKTFYYFIFTEKRTMFFAGNRPYDSYSDSSFAEMGGYTQQEMEDYGLAYEDEIISNVLSAITRRYITEGWDSNKHYDTVVFVTVDESGRNCFWLKEGGFFRINADKSVDYIFSSEEEKLLNSEIVGANSGFSTFDYTTEDIFRCNIEEELGLDFIKTEEPTPTPSE